MPIHPFTCPHHVLGRYCTIQCGFAIPWSLSSALIAPGSDTGSGSPYRDIDVHHTDTGLPYRRIAPQPTILTRHHQLSCPTTLKVLERPPQNSQDCLTNHTVKGSRLFRPPWSPCLPSASILWPCSFFIRPAIVRLDGGSVWVPGIIGSATVD